MASLIQPFNLLLSQIHPRRFPPRPISPPAMSPRLRPLRPPLRFRCRSGGVSSSTTAIERAQEKPGKESRKSGMVRIRLRLDLQVEFGDHVAVLGSSKELGSWAKQLPMQWTEAGWVCGLDLRGGEAVEFKFVILTKGAKEIIWEEGENRVFAVPESGVYDLVCGWNKTREVVDLLAGKSEEEVEGEGDGDGSNMETDAVVAEADADAEGSPFVEQWQGSDVSFMRSNEHRNREIERRWDTKGLDGLALELVEGDKTARNWWRKDRRINVLMLKIEAQQGNMTTVENALWPQDESTLEFWPEFKMDGM